MKYLVTLTLSCLMYQFSFAQEDNPLAFLEALMGKTWAIEAEWGDGSVFKQELTLEYGLQDKVVYTYTTGYIDQDRTEFGDRNFGVRKYDAESGKVLFWEFDTFGGVTTGEVIPNGKDIWFIYQYGEMTIADIWQYVDEDTYTFSVVSYDNQQIGDMYLQGTYQAKQ